MNQGFSRDSRYREGRADIVSDMGAMNRWQEAEAEKRRKGSLKEKVRRLLGRKPTE